MNPLLKVMFNLWQCLKSILEHLFYTNLNGIQFPTSYNNNNMKMMLRMMERVIFFGISNKYSKPQLSKET